MEAALVQTGCQHIPPLDDGLPAAVEKKTHFLSAFELYAFETGSLVLSGFAPNGLKDEVEVEVDSSPGLDLARILTSRRNVQYG